ncbi:PilW family protein [Candidatus Margulisiibacteriota bacterium]
MLRTIKGLTLIELVLAITLSLVALMVVAVSYSVSVRSFTSEMSRSDIFQDGQRALETITEELRESLGVTAAGSDNIRFWWKDLNENTTLEADEVVEYSLSGQTLIRTLGSTPEPVARNVSAFSLDYDVPADPTLVTVILTMQDSETTVSLEGKAGLRNK